VAVAALIAWAATAGGGFILLGTWLTRGGPDQHRAGRSRFAPKLIFSHFGLAAAGLAVWIVALATGTDGLRWAAVALLPFVAALGIVMFLKWLGGRGAHAGRHESDPPAEQHFPVGVVALHGVLAVVTVLLALLAALGLRS
jgi:hypothetical protein